MTVPSEARYVTLAAPTGGMNTYDTLASMPPQDAVSMVNMVPFTWGVAVRKGFQIHAQGLGGHVHSLIPWTGETPQLWAVAAGNLFNVTASVAGPAPVLDTLGTAFWHYVNFATAGGQYTVAVNGEVDPILFDGTSPPPRLVTGDGTTVNTIKGVDPKKLVQVTSHQRRLWFVEKGTTVGWYLPADSYYGEVKPFDFGPLFKRGGKLRMLATWTVDDGEGANDHLCAFSDNGDVVVYAGTDVDTPESWSMKSVYFIGNLPAGRRLHTKVGGDVQVLTTVGLVSLSTLVTSTQVNVTSDNMVSKKIQYLLSTLVSRLHAQPYWETVYTPTNNVVMINVPQVFDGGAGQLVDNQVNAGWSAFSGQDACNWLTYEDVPYFGDTAGNVCKAWTGYTDKAPSENVSGTVAQPIKWRCQQAYNYFEAPAVQKQVGMVRLNFLVGTDAEYATWVFYDFRLAPKAPPNFQILDPASYWDVDFWDIGKWSGDAYLQRRWEMAEGIGVAASLAVAGVSVDEVTWVSTDMPYKVGGIL